MSYNNTITNSKEMEERYATIVKLRANGDFHKEWEDFNKKCKDLIASSTAYYGGSVSVAEMGVMLHRAYRHVFGDDYWNKIPCTNIPKTFQLLCVNIGSGYICGETFENLLRAIPKVALRSEYEIHHRQSSERETKVDRLNLSVDMAGSNSTVSNTNYDEDHETRKYEIRDKHLYKTYAACASSFMSRCKKKEYSIEMIRHNMEYYRNEYNTKYGTNFDIYLGKIKNIF